MTKRVQFNLIVASIATITIGGLSYLFYETHISVEASRSYNEAEQLSYISSMINDSDIIFNANEDLKAEQLVDLERC
jgi:hypothetical protein